MVLRRREAPESVDPMIEPLITVALEESEGGTGSGATGPHLHISGRRKCGGFIWKVQTAYATAWVTQTADARGPEVRVPRLSVKLNYTSHGYAPVEAVRTNVAKVGTSEQLRGVRAAGICSKIYVTAEARLADGRRLRARGPDQ